MNAYHANIMLLGSSVRLTPSGGLTCSCGGGRKARQGGGEVAWLMGDWIGSGVAILRYGFLVRRSLLCHRGQLLLEAGGLEGHL